MVDVAFNLPPVMASDEIEPIGHDSRRRATISRHRDLGAAMSPLPHLVPVSVSGWRPSAWTGPALSAMTAGQKSALATDRRIPEVSDARDRYSEVAERLVVANARHRVAVRTRNEAIRALVRPDENGRLHGVMEVAAAIGTTHGYVSNLVAGRRSGVSSTA